MAKNLDITRVINVYTCMCIYIYGSACHSSYTTCLIVIITIITIVFFSPGRYTYINIYIHIYIYVNVCTHNIAVFSPLVTGFHTSKSVKNLPHTQLEKKGTSCWFVSTFHMACSYIFICRHVLAWSPKKGMVRVVGSLHPIPAVSPSGMERWALFFFR